MGHSAMKQGQPLLERLDTYIRQFCLMTHYAPFRQENESNDSLAEACCSNSLHREATYGSLSLTNS
jgi:predicted phosphohydrolase